MPQHTTLDEANTHGHAAFLYETLEERLELLAQYFQEGLQKNELCVFVTPDSEVDAIASFKAIGFDPSEAIKKGALRVFSMKQTYLPDGHFAADYMLQNVNDFLEEAKQLGYSGLRTAGEMAWLYDHEDQITDAISYEDSVNGLATPDDNFIGLCLYPMAHDSFNKVLGSVLQTHPSFIYDGQVQPSPYFGRPEPALT